jgi:hypothetical protein
MHHNDHLMRTPVILASITISICAVYPHVLADAFTSVTAISAVAGKFSPGRGSILPSEFSAVAWSCRAYSLIAIPAVSY